MSLAGSILRLARHRTGLSQRELAARAGTSQAAVAAYESGRRDATVGTLQRLLRAADLELRVRLEPIDRYSESLPRVLAEQYGEEDPAQWHEVRSSWAAQGRRGAGVA